MRGGRKYSSITLILSALVFIGAAAAYGKPLTFNGLMSSQHTDEEGDTSQISQSTTFNHDAQLTPVMSLAESVRYTTSWKEGSETETVNPYLDLEVNNDLFYFDLSGTLNKLRNSERSDLTSRSWQSRWNSNWQKELWPALQFNYGGSRTGDDENPNRLDANSTSSGFNIDWDLLLAKVYYSIDLNESDDYVADSNNKSSSQLGRLTTDKSFWQDRVSFSFLGQYDRNNQDFSATLDSRGRALVPVRIRESRGGWDDKDVDEEPDWNDLSANLPMVIHDQRYNVGLQVDSQQVNAIYLYTDSDLTDDASRFRWTVYTSNDGTTWVPQTPSPQPVYNSIMQRFELETPELRYRYVMLVEEKIRTDSDFNITRVEAYTRVTGETGERISTETETANYLGDSSVRLRVTDALQLMYNLILEDGETALGHDLDRTYNATSLLWTPSLLFSSTLSASESRDQEETDEEERNRFYSISCSSQLLPTLDINLGVTRNDNYEADVKSDTSYNYNVFLTALIFPDLTSNLDLTYLTDRDEEKDLLGQDFDSTLKFTARLNPSLTIDLTEKYATSHDEKSNSWSAASIISTSWRPSDILSFEVGFGREWESEDSFPFTYFFSLTVAPTYKTQLNLNFDHSESADSYNATYSWTINKIFSMQAYTTYAENKDIQDSQDSQDSEGSGFEYGGQLVVRY